MASEIERKFLIHFKLWEQIKKPEPAYLKQAYIVEENQKIVRVRIKNEEAFLTIKGKTEGIERLEFEYNIPVTDANELISQLGGPIIEKDRFEIKYLNHIWEVDVFYGDNEGLIVAEIELNSVSEEFEKPEWIGEEVSADSRYFNSNLQRHPFCEW